jgi:hypothetical protein
VLSGIDGPSGGSDLLEESIDLLHRASVDVARRSPRSGPTCRSPPVGAVRPLNFDAGGRGTARGAAARRCGRAGPCSPLASVCRDSQPEGDRAARSYVNLATYLLLDAFRRDCAERARQGRWTVAPPGLPARTASPDRRRARSSLVIASDTLRGGHVEPLDLARYAAAGQAAQASDAPDAPVHSYLPPELATR